MSCLWYSSTIACLISNILWLVIKSFLWVCHYQYHLIRIKRKNSYFYSLWITRHHQLILLITFLSIFKDTTIFVSNNSLKNLQHHLWFSMKYQQFINQGSESSWRNITKPFTDGLCLYIARYISLMHHKINIYILKVIRNCRNQYLYILYVWLSCFYIKQNQMTRIKICCNISAPLRMAFM